MTTIPPTIVALRQGWQDFRSAWKAATGFLLFITALDWALLSPLIAWGLEAIVRSAGAVAITNADLTGFVLSYLVLLSCSLSARFNWLCCGYVLGG